MSNFKKKIVVFSLLVLFVFDLSKVDAINAQTININQTFENNIIIFKDVPVGHWAREQIENFYRSGIVSGYQDGSFRPDKTVSREEFSKLLVSTFHQALPSTDKQSFSDVKTDRWSYPYIEVTKEFMTANINPFGGLPTFRPDEIATREDITVALVKMMGLSPEDSDYDYHLSYKFFDYSDISPNLRGYIGIASEKGIIGGYPDGTFKPQKGITRAEIISLLNRVTKQAMQDIASELYLEVENRYSEDGKTMTIAIFADEGTKVSVDGKEIKMSKDYYENRHEGNYLYKFEKEETKEFKVVAVKAGKSRTIVTKGNYEVSAPELTVNALVSTSNNETISISGNVIDLNDESPKVTVNGENVQFGYYNGYWSKEVKLKEGENTFKIVATNKSGKSKTIEKKITFNVGGPELFVSNLSPTSDDENITISGNVYDKNDDEPSLTINGENVSLYSSGARSRSWSKEVKLKEGENVFKIIATNKSGKSKTIEKKVTFNIGGPELRVSDLSPTSDNENITISGSVYDRNSDNISLTINGENVSLYSSGMQSRSWSKEVRLKDGENIFRITATNELGKTKTIEKKVKFSVKAPKIILSEVPQITQKSDLRISGTVENGYDDLQLYINDELLSLGYENRFNRDITLNEGENIIIIRAVNKYNKSTTVSKKVMYMQEIKAPNLSVDDIPNEVNEGQITISGSVEDSIDPYVNIFVNDKKVSSQTGNWSTSVSLNEGNNEIIIVATNSYKKSTTIRKNVFYMKAQEFSSTPENSENETPSVNQNLDK